MLRIKLTVFIAPLLFVIACNAPTPPADTANENKDSTPVVPATETFNIPPAAEVNSVILGKGGCKILSDTLGVRMTECSLLPGDSAKVHSHPDHAVYALQGGTLTVWFNGGADPVVMDMKAGDAFVGGPITDIAKNTGKSTIKLLTIDLYRPRAK